VDDQIKAGVGEGRQIAHVALDGLELEAFAPGDLAVALELGRRQIEGGDRGARGGEQRPLLSPGRGQAEDPLAGEIAVPVARHRLGHDQDVAIPAGPPARGRLAALDTVGFANSGSLFISQNAGKPALARCRCRRAAPGRRRRR
jgi:hypothetical protein